eukprot:tig00020509_g9743.t1
MRVPSHRLGVTATLGGRGARAATQMQPAPKAHLWSVRTRALLRHTLAKRYAGWSAGAPVPASKTITESAGTALARTARGSWLAVGAAWSIPATLARSRGGLVDSGYALARSRGGLVDSGYDRSAGPQ